NGIGGLLSPRDGDEELEDEEEEKTEDETKDGVSSRGSAKQVSVKSSGLRKKKGEGLVEKIVRLVKKILFLVTTAGALTFLLKYLKYALEVKRFMLAVAYFILKAIKCWVMIKYGKHHHDTGVEFQHVKIGEEHHFVDEESHEDDHHDHYNHHDYHDHHDHHDHYGHHGDEHGDWGRNDRAQHLAYRNRVPQNSGWSLSSLF
ncbi:unnamed protein product, partial [Acanthoscelides obtectus]